MAYRTAPDFGKHTPSTDTPATTRRALLQAGSACALLPWPLVTLAQESSRVVQVRGDVLRNGQPLTPQDAPVTGDRIETGPGASAVFTVGNSAFLLRENTRLELQGSTPWAVRVLRLLTGGVASVWGRGSDREIATPALTAGIRGTGVYTEVRAHEDFRSYFCNCYGTVDLRAGDEQVHSVSEYHQSFWAEARPRHGKLITPTEAVNHTDEEMEMLAALVQQRTTWQITGRKGAHDGRGGYRPYAPSRSRVANPDPYAHTSPN